MTDLSLAQHSNGSARCGFTSSAISMNSALQSRRTTRSTNYAALVIGRCGSIHSGFGSAIQTCHKEAPGRAPRASRPDAPQRPNARIYVRFAPKATEVLHCSLSRSYALDNEGPAIGGLMIELHCFHMAR